jgi:hypothetical protein
MMKDDAISRRDAIDRIEGITASMSVCVNSDEANGMRRMKKQAILELTNMPSVHSKNAIMCKDCKFSDEFDGDIWICRRYKEPFRVLAIDTCNVAERKEE